MDDLSSRLASLSPAKRALLQKMLEKARPADGAIPRRAPGSAPGLSFAQQRLWFLDQLEGPSATYNMPTAFRMRGALDVTTLERALGEIIRRHEVLRTNILQSEGMPVAELRADAAGYFTIVDLAGLTANERDAEIAQRSTEDARQPFDLARDRLIRVTILRFGPDDHAMLVNMHHIVSDGWSLGVIVKEMLTLYTAMAAGQDSPLPELPIQYGDFALWQRERLSGPQLDPQITFWREHLSGVPALLALPTDRPRPPVQTFRGRTHQFTIDRQRLDAIKALSRKSEASLFMTLSAALSAVMWRYSRQDDFVIGTPVANRVRTELEPLVGFFVNTLAMRMNLSGDPSAGELIQRVKQTAMGAFRNQDVPFERLVEELQPARQLGFSPIFQVMFILQNAPLDAVRLPGVELEEIAVDAGTSMFDLTLKLRERGGVIEGELEFNTDLFELATIERLVAHYQSMLDGMVADPSMPVSRVPLLTAGERDHVLIGLNTTATPVVDKTVVELFEDLALREPDRIALQCGGQTLDYAALGQRASQLAGFLQSIGVGPETPVGLCVPRSFDTVVGLLGIMKSGGAYVPLDPAFPTERLALMVDNSRLRVILATAETASLLPDGPAIRVFLDRDWDAIAAAPPPRPIALRPAHLAYVLYTSGSTGTPKGVQISHGALVNFLESMRREPGLDRDDVLLAVTTISFDISALELFLPLMVGARVVIVPQDTAADGFKLLDAMRASGANVMQATPATWQMLLATDWQGAPLKRCFCGGEALSTELSSRLLAKGLELWNLYGPTETAIWSAISRVEAGEAGGPSRDAKEPIGRPIANTQIYIVDPNLQPVPVGVPGELCIAGDGLARGYFRRPDLTAAVFVPNPFGAPGARMYKTGDLCRYRPDGGIEFIGRVDHQIKLRGFRIELGEIEAVIDEHPSVRQSVVVCREDQPGRQQLVAYIQRDIAVQPATHTGAVLDGQVDKWRTVWNDIYERGGAERDDTFDTSGWMSSYTGQLIPAADMRAWLDETVARILALSPKRVMEIGCGTGMVLHHVAPHVDAFTGIDISESVVARLRASVERRGMTNVTLRRAHADASEPADRQSYDAVVLNSVIQYFPSADYLLDVLAAAAEAVKDGGAIFLGDVRSLPLAQLFRTSVEFFKAGDDCSRDELSRRVSAATGREEELLVAPDFFTAFRSRLPRLSQVELQVKRHSALTEMSRFRYDIVLRLGGPIAGTLPELVRVDGAAADLDREGLRGLLEAQSADTVLIDGLLNQRLASDATVLQWLGDRTGDDSVSAVRARLASASNGIDPAEVWQIGEALGYSVSVRWSQSEPGRRIDALFHRGDGRSAAQLHAVLVQDQADGRPLSELTNDPVRNAGDRVVIAEVRKSLASRLPSYMQPSSILCLEQFPLTPNGKVNRAELPAPDVVTDDEHYVAPSTDIERQLAEIWTDVLDVARVGAGDNFFELGGHSLLAMQMISRIREKCAIELPIQALFDAPRLGDLAARLVSDRGTQRPILPPIRAIDRDRAAGLPLSFAQQRLWFLDQLEGSSTSYNQFGAVRFDGPLNVSALEGAFREVVRRHEVLRTNFIERDGHPVVVIERDGGFALEHVDLEDRDERKQQEEIDRWMDAEVARPFDLAHDRLMRAILIRTSPTCHRLLLSVHHIISDEWSMGVLIHELSELYAACERGEGSPLPELPIQYADYAAWQRSWLGDSVIGAQREFWRKELTGAPALLELPTDRPRPKLQRHRGRVKSFVIEQAVALQVEALGKQTDSTLFMAALAGYAILLQRYTGATDIVIGSPVANRVRPELESLLGFFVNTLPFRIDLSGDPSIRELLARVRRTALAAYGNQDVPFEQLVEELQPERNLGHAPIFQVMLVLQNAPAPNLRHSAIEMSNVDPTAVAAKFDITLSLERTGAGLECLIEYDTDLFAESTIDRLAGHFRNVLVSMASEPARRVRDVQVLDAAEAHHLVTDLNATLSSDPAEPTVTRMFEAQAERSPDALAVRAGRETITYAALNDRANHIAAAMKSYGVGLDVTVGIFLPRGIDAVAGLLGVLKAGGCYVPLDLAAPPDRLRHMIEETRMAVVVTSRAFAGALPQTATALLLVEEIAPNVLPSAAVDPGNLAYIIYTSGSTGRPKGVTISHGNLVRSIAARQAYYSEPMSALFSPLSFAFDAGNGAIFWALCQGACFVVGPDDAMEPREFVDRLADSGCSHVVVGPALYGSMLDLATAGELATLRAVTVGGEALGRALVSRHAAIVPQATLYNEYGPTEATVWSAVARVQVDSQQAPDIGSASPGCRLYVLDRHLQPVPLGVVGELCVGGGQVARGYFGHPDLTAERFIPDPFAAEPGSRLYRTGDLVKRRDDGALEFLGRADNQVKIRGFRIELGDIESAINGHAGVRACAVVVHADASTGSKRLVAYCARAAGDTIGGADLQSYLKTCLPSHMVPSTFAFIDDLPLTANGKVDRRALPAVDAQDAAGGYTAPRTPTEQVLANIWEDVLGVDRVGVHDNFFELGGDSILSIQIISRANRAGLGLTVRQLFEWQTIGELARVAPERRAIHAEQGLVTGPLPLTPIQHWFFAGQSPEPHHCNQAVLLLARTPLVAAHAEDALRHLVLHHDALRSRFELNVDPPVARIAGAGFDTPFTVCDLSDMTPAAAGAAITADAERCQRSLHLETGPIVRAVLYRLGHGEADRLLIVVHHLAVDGVSWRILIEDFAQAYAQLKSGQPVTLPEKTTSFRHWAECLQSYAASSTVTGEADYWREVMNAPVAPLPRDHARDESQNTAASAEDVVVRLSPAMTQALLTLVPAAYRSQINDALLTALTRAMSAWTKGDAIRIVLEGHGREELFDDVDLSRTVGVFTSFFPVVLSRTADEGPGHTLARVKERLRSVPARGLRFGLLTYMNPSTSLRASPSTSLRASPATSLGPSGGVGATRDAAAEISFNYLGRFDGDGRSQVFSGLASESSGATQSAAGLRRYLIDVNGILNGATLEFNWTFSRHLHDRETIQAVADNFIRELELLVEHCRDGQSGGYTASDFPLAAPAESTLAALFERWGRHVEDAYPLAPMQQGMVFHSLFEEHSGVDIIQLACVLEGDVRPELFQRAWQHVVERHPALRTAFLAGHGTEPLQVVLDRVELPWQVLDWRGMPEAERSARLAELMRADRTRGFAIDTPPLMRCALIHLGASRAQFVWSHHHLLTDGWCLPILLNEAMAIYESLLAHRPVTLPATRPFCDFVRWLSQQDAEAATQFWRQTLSGFSSPTRLGIDRGAGLDERAHQFVTASLTLSREATSALQQLAQTRRVTLSIVVQAAWSVLLARYAGSSDIVFGATVSGRPPEIASVDSMIGLFINTLPVRVAIDEAETVAEFLGRLQSDQMARDAYAHVPLVEIQRCREVQAPEPLFESIVIFENYPMGDAVAQAGGSFTATGFEVFEQTNLPITLMTAPAEELPLRIAYDDSRFNRRDVDRMLAHLGRLLESIAGHSDGAVGNWPMLLEDEAHRSLHESSQTASQLRDDASTLATLFEAQAARTPSHTAAIAGDTRVTYESLNARANQVARRIRSAGVRPGARVGVFIERSIDMLVALVAINKALAAYVPMDPSFPSDRLSHMLDDSEASVVLTQRALRETVPASSAHVICIDDGGESAFAGDNLELPSHPSNAAYVIYTSGSTGIPKGVAVPGGALVNLLRSMQLQPGLHEHDVLLAVTTISFDIAALELFLPIVTGGTVAIADRDAARDGESLLAEMRRTGATVMQATPISWRLLLEAGWSGAPLTRAMCGGEALPRELSARLLATGIELWNVYGPTETTIWSSVHRVEHDASEEPNEPIGRPIHNTRFYVVDRGMRMVPEGVPGELLIGGDGLAIGYASRGDLTADRFVPDPFGGNPGDRLYRTGDLARHRADGSVAFLGRLDSQVKVRGFRIELGEIEATIGRQPDVKQSVVVAHRAAHGEAELVAYLVMQSGSALDVDALREALGRTLPHYMIPSKVVVLTEMPLTLNGKVNRRALPAPDESNRRSQVAPQTATERLLAGIWLEVFAIETIGIDDNFFELGGHSLLAAKVVGRIRAALKVAVPIPLLFRQPTIRQLSEYVDNTLWAAGQGAQPAGDAHDVEEVSL
jgi:amino acid adenylation domain-containing protein/non-ribosomal peptide synthase protein (TIGR01720 family)